MIEWLDSPIGTDVVVKLLLAVLTTVVTALAGAFGAWVRSQRRQHDEDRTEREERDAALAAGVRSLLRSEVLRTHHEAMARGSATTMEKEVLTRNYDAYHGLDGNGVATTLYLEAMGLPTKD
ncbi:hypothetical protein M1L65_07195 [Slackia exigua]|uniref:hypothetical protein n=1 Tax=Slackia exigua TaxID=84109 RepID=UPI0028DC5AB0|nr:hypothetical protein [Slackia exigua]